MGNICYSMFSICSPSKASNFPRLTDEIINKLDITPLQKLVLENRYIKVVETMDIKTKNTSNIYHMLSLLITVGSILVPSLLSIQEKPFKYTEVEGEGGEGEVKEQAHNVFWVTFVISLIVSMANGVIKLFSIDQTYIIRHLRYNDLRREGWLFFLLAGPYLKYSTHKKAIRAFIYNIEKIKTNQLKEEYTPESADKKEINTYESISTLHPPTGTSSGSGNNPNPNQNPNQNHNYNPDGNSFTTEPDPNIRINIGVPNYDNRSDDFRSYTHNVPHNDTYNAAPHNDTYNAAPHNESNNTPHNDDNPYRTFTEI